MKYVGINLDEIVLLNIFKEICGVNLNDEIKYEVLNNGDLKNLTKKEFNEMYPGLYYNNLCMDQAYPNGESPIDFYDRIKNAFVELINKYKGKKILLITHGGVITILQCLLNGWKYSNLLKITVPHATLVNLKIE